MMTEVDHHLGRVLDWLDETGAADDTLVVLTSDHGDQMGDHWLMEKLGWWDESYHVPMIVRDPRAPTAARGRQVDGLHRARRRDADGARVARGRGARPVRRPLDGRRSSRGPTRSTAGAPRPTGSGTSAIRPATWPRTCSASPWSSAPSTCCATTAGSTSTSPAWRRCCSTSPTIPTSSSTARPIRPARPRGRVRAAAAVLADAPHRPHALADAPHPARRRPPRRPPHRLTPPPSPRRSGRVDRDGRRVPERAGRGRGLGWRGGLPCASGGLREPHDRGRHHAHPVHVHTDGRRRPPAAADRRGAARARARGAARRGPRRAGSCRGRRVRRHGRGPGRDGSGHAGLRRSGRRRGRAARARSSRPRCSAGCSRRRCCPSSSGSPTSSGPTPSCIRRSSWRRRSWPPSGPSRR